MDSFIVICPNCGANLNADRQLIGKKVYCPNCEGEFIISLSEEESFENCGSECTAGEILQNREKYHPKVPIPQKTEFEDRQAPFTNKIIWMSACILSIFIAGLFFYIFAGNKGGSLANVVGSVAEDSESNDSPVDDGRTVKEPDRDFGSNDSPVDDGRTVKEPVVGDSGLNNRTDVDDQTVEKTIDDNHASSHDDHEKTELVSTYSSFDGVYDSIKPFLVDKHEMRQYWDPSMTSVQRSALVNKWYNSSLYLPMLSARYVFIPIPDGIVFRVYDIIQSIETPYNIGVKVSIVRAKNGYKDWEYRFSSELTAKDDIEGTDWADAPWVHQTDDWRKNIYDNFFPGIQKLRLNVFGTPTTERELIKWRKGTFIVSKGWYSAMPVSTTDERPQLGNYYRVFRSEAEILSFANESPFMEFAPTKVIGPRQGHDAVYSMLKFSKPNILKLSDRLKKTKGIPVGKILSEGLNSQFSSLKTIPEFSDLIAVAKKGDMHMYGQALDRALAKLSALEHLIGTPKAESDGNFAKWKFENESEAWDFAYGSDDDFIEPEKFQKIWDHSMETSIYKQNYCRVAFQSIPDDIMFVVNDVRKVNGLFAVQVEPLVYGAPSYVLNGRNKDKKPWMGNPKQNKDFWSYMAARYAIRPPARYNLYFSPESDFVLKWEKGLLIKSNGWIREIAIMDAIVTRTMDDGRVIKSTRRKVSLGHNETPFPLWSSMSDRMAWENICNASKKR